MKKIAIVSNGYAWFPCEAGPSRFYYIAQMFVKAGYEVEVITVDFQHFKKEPRDKKMILEQNYPFKITMVKTPPYKKNVDLRRIYSNKIVAKNIAVYLNIHVKEYDVVYCSIPANNVAAVTSEICRKNQVPFVVDIEDLWPEAMSMVIKNEKLRRVLLHSMERDAETAYKNASGVIGTSEDYTMRAFKRREKNIPYKTVYVGCDLADFDDGIKKYAGKIEKPQNEFWVTYAGSISTSYDIRTLIDSGRELAEKKAGEKEVHIQLLGTGSTKEELEKYVADNHISNVHFWGFTKYHKMAAVLSKSDVVVNSFVKGAPQSIVNKIGDYLSSGKPMINTLENPVFCELVEKNQVGVNIEPENVPVLTETILKFMQGAFSQMGENARKLAETEFDRKVAYQEIVKLAEKVSEK